MKYKFGQMCLTNKKCKKLTFLKILMKKLKISAIMKAQITIRQPRLPNLRRQ